MKSRLGVSIPTYKRPDQLAAAVRSVIAAGREFGTPIYVTDDSADDTNVAVFAALRSEYPLLVTIRNERNLGIDRNILHSVDVNPCEYVWLLGEDDRLQPNAIRRVLQVMEHHAAPPAFLYVNYASVDESLRFVLHERSLPIAQDRAVSAETFLAEHAWSAGFIGACIVRRDAWGRACRDPYVGTFFAHVGMLMETLIGREAFLLATPLVLNRCGTAAAFTWTGQAFDVLNGWERMVEALRAYYPPAACAAAVRSFERAHGLNTLKFFAYLRADGAYDAKAWRQFVQPAGRGAAHKWAAWAIARVPVWMMSAIRTAVNCVRFRNCPRISDPGLI